MKNIDFYEFKRWAWLIIIFTFLLTWCSSCSSTYHLKKAVQKNPALSLTDTVKQYKTLPGVTARFELDELLNTDRSVTIQDVEIKTVWRDSVRFVSVECPPVEQVTKYVPKVKFVTEELTPRQLVKQAKELGEVQRIRIAGSIVWGAILFGIFLGVIFAIIIRLKFFK
jgi:hypothetical protein